MSQDSFIVVTGQGSDAITGDDLYRLGHRVVAVRGPRAAIARNPITVLAFVGRLDNRTELTKTLGYANPTPGEATSKVAAEIALAAWMRWGPGFLDHLVGGFAGIVLDLRSNDLHVFRDLTAGETAYVTARPGLRVAGSDLVEVARLAGRTAEPSRIFIAGYLQRVVLDAADTAFDGVDAVVPGHIATTTDATASWRQRRHAAWHVRPIRHRRFPDLLEEFTAIFDESVRCRLEGSKRLGIALSGGLDSTNVLASIVRVAPEVRITAYAIPFYTERGDERNRQTEIARWFGIPIHWVPVAGRGPFGQWSGRLFAGRPTPPIGGNWYMMESLCESATANGDSLLYDGEDADSLLTGNRTYLADLLVTGRFLSWWREVQRIRAREGTSPWHLLKYSLYKQIPDSVLTAVGRGSRLVRPNPLITSELAEEVDLSRRLKRLPSARLWNPGRRFAQYVKLAGDPLQVGVYTPDIAMAARGTSLVLAHPFLDRRLMTFCMGLPWDAICGDFTPKRLLRELARRHLPAFLHTGPTKAVLDEYYEAAVFKHEKELARQGLDLAASRPELCDPGGVVKLRQEMEHEQASFAPSRVAMVMLWLDEIKRASRLGRGTSEGSDDENGLTQAARPS